MEWGKWIRIRVKKLQDESERESARRVAVTDKSGF